MIKFEDLERVNKEMNITDIKGKDYVEVNQRVIAFRKLYPNGTISTEILSIGNGVVVIKATILNEDGQVLSTGISYEKENSTFINKTSYIENCETSAVGRALGFAGFGISTSIASAEEVQTAILNQIPKKVNISQEMQDKLDERGIVDLEKIMRYYHVNFIDDNIAKKAIDLYDKQNG